LLEALTVSEMKICVCELLSAAAAAGCAVVSCIIF
jgi:hypothetical protein